MNDQNPLSAQPGTTPQSAENTAGVTTARGGHDIPNAFSAPVAPQGATLPVVDQAAATATQPTEPLPPHLVGSSFGAAAVPAASTEGGTARTGKRTRVAALLVAAALVGGASGLGGSWAWSLLSGESESGAVAGPSTVTVNNTESVTATTAVASKVVPSVVTIEVSDSGTGGSGSGVILSEDGYVLTNTHVVTLDGAAASPTVRVTTSDGRIYDATVVGTDPVYDLAVIKLTDAKDLTPIDFADSSELNVGSTAVAVGAPLGLSNSVTTGIVSALNRSISVQSSALPDDAQGDTQEQNPEQGEGDSPFQFDIPGFQAPTATESISIAVIQTDAAINPGNSGGALVDGNGELIGINVAIATAGQSTESGSIGVGFAIPSNVAQRVADEIIADGSASHGLLGANVKPASSEKGATVAGAVIADTVEGGAAAAAGLQAGDIVTAFNDVPVTNSRDLTAQVRAAAAGSEATVTFVRDGKTENVTVTLGTLEL